MKEVVVFCQVADSVGVKVVVDNFIRILGGLYKVSVSESLPKSKDSVYIIPYGIKNTYLALKHNYNVPISLMTDYYSLSQWNTIKFFCQREDFWMSKFSIKTTARFIKYYIIENYVFTHCKNFMFVSQTDINNVKKRFPYKNYYCVPNGVKIPGNYSKNKKNSSLIFGFLSIWLEESFYEHKWFLDSFWPFIVDKYPNASIKICGRHASKKMIQYVSSFKNVDFIGEVDSLSVFFDMIDVYLVPIPKGCGILNKVLDAFAHKTLVVGLTPSFSGFTYMKDSYVEFNTLDDFLKFVDDFYYNRNKYDTLVNNAYENIKIYNDWDTNYSKFIKTLKQQKVLTP